MKVQAAGADVTGVGTGDVARRGWLLRWVISAAALNIPLAAAPIAFSLLALDQFGDAKGGAAMMLSMTLAQVVGVIPITRLGRRFSPTAFLRALVVFRTGALAGVALCAQLQLPLALLIVLAALAGSVNGAAYGYLRTQLNGLVPQSGLPRALGLAATLNEIIFVLGPVAASGLGVLSPVLAIAALTVLGAMPALLVPAVSVNHADVPTGSGSILTLPILLWLSCAAAGGAAVAVIEIGAVGLAVQFGYEPALGILFTVPLCVASVSGGIWVSYRNRMASRGIVVTQLATVTLGSWLAAMNASLPTTIAGAVLMGAMLAPLGTYYALSLDMLAPPHKRAEVFGLLRTATIVGVICASALLTAFTLSTALVVVAVAILIVTAVVALVPSNRLAPR